MAPAPFPKSGLGPVLILSFDAFDLHLYQLHQRRVLSEWMTGCDPFPRNRQLPGDEGQKRQYGPVAPDNLTADDGRNSHPCVNQEMPLPSGSD